MTSSLQHRCALGFERLVASPPHNRFELAALSRAASEVQTKSSTGRDALVTLQASREMIETDGRAEEQYQTTNLLSRSITKICVNPAHRSAATLP